MNCREMVASMKLLFLKRRCVCMERSSIRSVPFWEQRLQPKSLNSTILGSFLATITHGKHIIGVRRPMPCIGVDHLFVNKQKKQAILCPEHKAHPSHNLHSSPLRFVYDCLQSNFCNNQHEHIPLTWIELLPLSCQDDINHAIRGRQK